MACGGAVLLHGQPPIPRIQNPVWDGGVQGSFKAVERGVLVPTSQA